jgi:hypothetical protein
MLSLHTPSTSLQFELRGHATGVGGAVRKVKRGMPLQISLYKFMVLSHNETRLYSRWDQQPSIQSSYIVTIQKCGTLKRSIRSIHAAL